MSYKYVNEDDHDTAARDKKEYNIYKISQIQKRDIQCMCYAIFPGEIACKSINHYTITMQLEEISRESQYIHGNHAGGNQ
jgi:hypothetical protein